MPIRLLCCSGSLDGGGSERQLWQLATGVERSKFAPQFYLHYRRGKYLRDVPPDIPVHDFWSDCDTTNFRLPGQIHRTQVRHLRKVLVREKIDVVYDRTFHMTLVTGSACRTSHCPRVSVIVSPPSQDFARSQERFAFIKKWLLRWAYCEPTGKTLAVSESVAEDARRFYKLNPATIEVVSSPVDVDSVVAASKDTDLMIPPISRRVCVVGRMSREKGHRLAIEAFDRAAALLRDRTAILELVGEGPERGGLESLVAGRAISRQVNFHGFQDNPYPVIAAADLLLIASDYEGLPNVALEAMALRTAVIATDCSASLRELLGDGLRGQIVPLGDTEGLAHAIVDRFLQPARWSEVVACAFDYVLRHHSLRPWLAKMEQLLTEQVTRR